ncbi:zinc finger protein 91-like isoform X1 [Schistocerca nitens]|uniref:zinc finger protein 91-like isoform X1 n=1 Tax=Schistocerca nitens TaxID=7011 RepID=UPI002117BA62|nr:zinc finger protein 91-like isoform X1 [Schistocerca nitens]
MQPSRSIPSNMSEICRLCLSSEGSILPIFGEEEAEEPHIPLSFRILACVSVEVTHSDGLPSLICQQCLKQVDSWTEFKQQCDASQATLKEWQRAAEAAAALDSSTNDTPDRVVTSVSDVTDLGSQPSPAANKISSRRRHFIAVDQVKETTIKQEPPDDYGNDDDDILEDEEEEEEEDDDSMTELVDDAESVSSCEDDRRMYSHVPVEIKQEEIEVSDGSDNEYSHNSQVAGSSTQVDSGLSKNVVKTEREGSGTEAGNHHGQSQRLTRRPRRLFLARKKRFGLSSGGSKIFPCHVCNKGFGRKSHAIRHEMSHSHMIQLSQATSGNSCLMCNKTFSNRSNLDRHLRLHRGHQLQTALELGNTRQNGPSWQNSEPNTGQAVESGSAEPEADYYCYLCGKTFLSQYRLKMHMGQHSNYKCPKCGKCFKGGTALSNHLRIHNIRGFVKHTCRFCMRSFASLAAMMSHRKTHYRAGAASVHTSSAQPPPVPPAPPAHATSAPTPVPAQLSVSQQSSTPMTETDSSRGNAVLCRLCNKWFNSFSMLEQHLVTHSTNKPYSCSVCGLLLGYASSVYKHMRKMHGVTVDYHTIRQQLLGTVPPAGPPAPRINPPFCGPAVQSRPEQPVPQPTTFPCTFCSRTFTHKSFLAAHIRATHTGTNGTHQCQLCGHAFAHRYLLLRHIKTHGGFTCLVCMKQFSDLRTLNNHKGVHKRFKLLQCPLCSQSFNGVQRLEAHKAQAHPLANAGSIGISYLFHCDTCGERFATRSELAQHRESHISLKLYTCQVCKNSYNSSSALSKHKRKHGHYESSENVGDMPDNKPFVCSECGKVFNDAETYTRHLAVHRRRSTPTPLIGGSTPSTANSPAESSHCTLCNRTFRDHLSLIRHKGWHTRRPNQIPVIVNHDVSEETTSAAVLADASSPNSRLYPCDYCNKSYSNAGSLSKHRRTNCPRLHVSNVEQTDMEPETLDQEDEDEDIKPVLQPLVVLQEDGDDGTPVATSNGPVTIPTATTSFERHPCALCPKVFRTPKALVVHRGWHARSPRPSPPQLPFADSSSRPKDDGDGRSYTLMDASETMDENRLYRCNACWRTFSNTSAFRRHKCLAQDDLMIHRSTPSTQSTPQGGGVSCPICDRKCSKEKYLLQHMKIHTTPNTPGGSTAANGVVSTSKTNAQNFQMKGSDPGTITMKDDDVDVTTVDDDDDDDDDDGDEEGPNVTTSGDGPGITCQICQRQFKKEKYLIQHVRIHTGEKPFSCSECGRCFSRQSVLWKHKKSHKGSYKCPSCPQNFFQSELLQKHLVEDHGQVNGIDAVEQLQTVTENGIVCTETSAGESEFETD